MEPGTILDDRFRLEEPIGEGGMGTVWRAFDLKLEGPVAVKLVPLARLGKSALSRFGREAKAAAVLRSPHVVQVLDHGQAADTAYIAMELLDGESLKARIDRGKLSPDELLAVLEPIGRVLDRAHDKGIIHRDLKPGNIQLVNEGANVIPKLLDFGIAKMSGALDDETKTGSLMGTPYYMSPEQLTDSKRVDHHADLWAIAIIAYEALLTVRPFHGDTIGELVARLLRDPPPVPSKHGDVPAMFDAWFARATSQDVARRFDRATEMIEALRGALLGDDTAPANEDGDAFAETVTIGATDDAATMRRAVDAASIREDASGTSPPMATSGARDTGRMGWFAAAGACVFAGAFYFATRTEDNDTTPSSASATTTQTTKRTVTSSAPREEAATWSAFPCAKIKGLDAPPTCKRDTYVAWCDRANKQVACCAPGLAPLKPGGSCDCPPGGSSSADARDSGCEQAIAFDRDSFQGTFRAIRPELQACYEAALARNAKLKGTVTFDVALDPRGHVFSVRIQDSSLPDATAQRCVIDIWKRMRFVPPADGALDVSYPVTFSDGSETK